MSGLTKLSLKELYDLRDSLEGEMHNELSMDASGDCQDSIVDLFQPKIQKVEEEIDSRSEVEFDQYHWPEDDTDPAGGRGLASHV